MNAVQEIWLALGSVAHGHPAGLLALALGGVVLAHTAIGLGWVRLWYMFPLHFGLVALAGFLLNPFADATTPHDLRAKLINPEVLTLLCISQFILASLALGLGQQLREDRPARGSWLAIIHVVPAPLLVIAMLVLEQTLLVQAPGSRPEAVGRQVGFAVATLVTVAGLLALLLPRRWLMVLHGLLGVTLVLACMLLPCLQTPLPEPLDLMDWPSLDWCWQVALGFAVLIGLGCLWGSRPSLRQARPAAG